LRYPDGYSFTYTLLHNRLMGLCHGLLRAYEAAPPTRDGQMTALSVILLCDCSVEIAIHHRIEQSLPPREIAAPLRQVFRVVRAALLRQRPPVRRLEELGLILNVIVDWTAEPWRSVRDLHDLRNALAHYEASPLSSDHPDSDVFPRRRQLQPLAERLGTAEQITGADGWLGAFLNPVCARWAYDTADTALRQIDRGPLDLNLRFNG
jgi:hypothetical protein